MPGIGTSIIEGLTRSELRGTVDLSYERHGAQHVFDLTLDSLERPDGSPDEALDDPALVGDGHGDPAFAVAR